MTDPDREVPAGTLSWKIIYSGHLAETHVKGPDADIAKGQTDAHWTVQGSAKLAGDVTAGKLDRSGNENDDLPTPASSTPSPLQQIANQCGDNQTCQLAALTKMRHNAKAMATMQARDEAMEAFTSRLDTWTSDVAADGAPCHISVVGSRTSDWRGGARFAGNKGIVTIPYSAHESFKGSAIFKCTGDEPPRIALRADPTTGVYNLLLPTLRVDATHDTQFTTTGPQPNAKFHATADIHLPAVTVKGIPLPTSLQTLHGEKTIHAVGSILAARRNVHLHGHSNATANMYAVAKAQPAIPLNAKVSWTFTPDHD